MYQSISTDLKLVEVMSDYPERFNHLSLGDSFSCLIFKGKAKKIRLPRLSETEIHSHELKTLAFGYQKLTLKLSSLVLIIHGRSLVPINEYVKGNPQLLWAVVGNIRKVEMVMRREIAQEYLKSV